MYKRAFIDINACNANAAISICIPAIIPPITNPMIIQINKVSWPSFRLSWSKFVPMYSNTLAPIQANIMSWTANAIAARSWWQCIYAVFITVCYINFIAATISKISSSMRFTEMKHVPQAPIGKSRKSHFQENEYCKLVLRLHWCYTSKISVTKLILVIIQH